MRRWRCEKCGGRIAWWLWWKGSPWCHVCLAVEQLKRDSAGVGT